MQYKYPVAKPELPRNGEQYLLDAYRSGWLGKGPYIERLEVAFAKYIGTRYAVVVDHGFSALRLVIKALRLDETSEILVPDFTMAASAWAADCLGAKLIFIDCDETLNINVDLIEHAITSKTSAIMPVHIYGRMADMTKIMELAYKYNLYVIEDACESVGAIQDGKKAGSFGIAGCFSLYSNKILTAGEGGIITTNDERLYEQLVHLRSMAFDKTHSFFHPKRAENCRITNLQAAVCLAQLEQIDEFLVKRKQIQAWYDKYLPAGLQLPRAEGSVLWMMDVVFADKKERDIVMQRCLDNGVECRYFFKPMSWQPFYKGYSLHLLQQDGKMIHKAAQFADRGMYLPVYTGLTEENVKEICSYAKS